MEGKMKKFLLVLFILIFASSASASVYKWVDERGVVNFADDYSKVPLDYRSKVEEVRIAKAGPSTFSQNSSGNLNMGAQPGKTATQAPPVAAPLIREGDFAIKLVEALKIGRAGSEEEAESILASAGIAPKNGWIADYPMTPDIIGELEKAIIEAADARKLPMGKDEALRVFRTTALELELPIIAEIPTEIPDRYAESPYPEAPQYAEPYTEPTVINNYYYTEGPPVMTYYPPPPDYSYLYGWIPSPFWYSGFYFPGYYILHDFHRVAYRHGHPCTISNHMRDHRTGRMGRVYPERRYEGRTSPERNTPPTRGFNSTEARNGARSIYERSRERVAMGNTTPPVKDRGLNNRNPAYGRSGQGTERQVYNREGNSSGFNNRNSNYAKPPVVDRRMSRNPNETGSNRMNDRTFNRSSSVNRQYGMNFQRPPSGETRSFNQPSRGSERSFSQPPQGGGQRFNSPPTGNRGFSGSYQGGNRGSFSPPTGGSGRSFSPPSQGGGQHFSSPPSGNRGFSGSYQGGNRGNSFGFGSPRF
jgi:hypothetical protein